MPRNGAVNSSFWDQPSGTRLSRAGREAISFWVTLSKWQVILLLIPLLPREAHGNRYPCECQRIWLSYLRRLGLLPAPSQMECIQIKAPWHRPPSLERLLCKGNGISPKLWRYYFLIFSEAFHQMWLPVWGLPHTCSDDGLGVGQGASWGLPASYFSYGLWF